MSNLSESIRMPVLQTAQKSLDRLASRTPWLRLANQREKPFRSKFSGHLACSAKVPNTEVEIQSQLPFQTTASRFSFLLNPIPWSFGMFSNDPWSSNIVSALSFVQKLTSCKIMNHSLLINDSGAKMQMQRHQVLGVFLFFTCTSCLIALSPPMAEGQNLCLLPSQSIS